MNPFTMNKLGTAPASPGNRLIFMLSAKPLGFSTSVLVSHPRVLLTVFSTFSFPKGRLTINLAFNALRRIIPNRKHRISRHLFYI